MHMFEQQDSAQTLAEGIREYYERNPGLATGRALSPEAQEFFRCHDAAHVIFGCGNNLDDEAVVKIASIFGTSGGFGILRGYRLHESFEIYKSLRVMDVLTSILRSIAIVPRTIYRCCFQQRRKWQWDRFDEYMHLPLKEIRQSFGIKVAHFGKTRKGTVSALCK